MCHLQGTFVTKMDVPQRSNINLANHQGIVEELWILKFHGLYLSSVKASLPGCWCCLWKGRVEMEFNTSLEVYCLEGNWEYLESHSEWRATKMRFLTACWPNTFGWAFWVWAQNEEKHTWKFPERWNVPAVFNHVMVWPMIQLTGLVIDHLRHIHSAIPFLTEVCCSLGRLRSLESLGSFRTTFTTDDNVPYGPSSDFFSALRCGRKFNDCKDQNERHDIPWTHKTFTSATGRFCQHMFPVASWTYLQKMSLFYPPNFWGVHSSRQFIESNPHPLLIFSHLRYIAFSWSHEVRSKTHQADVTTKTRNRHVWLVWTFAPWKSPCSSSAPSGSWIRKRKTSWGPIFWEWPVTVESLHHWLRFSKWRSMVEIFMKNGPTSASKFTNIATNWFSGWGVPSNPWVKTPTFVGRKRSVSWAVNLGKCCRVDRNHARVWNQEWFLGSNKTLRWR